MPKASANPDLQQLVRSHIAATSACELGRVAGVHRSSVLRFSETGRATSATAHKLTVAMATLSIAQSNPAESATASSGNPGAGGHAHAAVQQQIPQELLSLRTMLQTLISLIDGQYGRLDLPAERNAAPADTASAS